MTTKRVLIGTLVATIVLFLTGAVLYGMLLSGFMEANCDTNASRPKEDMLMGAIMLSNVVSGLLVALVMEWTACRTFANGFRKGAILGLLVAMSFDLSMYAMTTLYLNVSVIFVDSVAYGLMLGLAGGVAAWAMTKWGRPAVTA